MEDVGHEEWFIREVEAGLAQVRGGQTLPHEEVVARLEALIANKQRKKEPKSAGPRRRPRI
jgi:predicted transcriptional regulator